MNTLKQSGTYSVHGFDSRLLHMLNCGEVANNSKNWRKGQFGFARIEVGNVEYSFAITGKTINMTSQELRVAA